MAWLVCGTIPDPSLPPGWQTLAYDIEDGCLTGDADFARLHVQRGTPTLYAACLLACRVLGVESPRALFVGDIGDGVGSAALYAELCARLSPNADEFSGITFHYLFPDLDGHNRVLASLEGHAWRPMLVADAGFMYAAKMSGYAKEYDLFTPDAGELAFLADENAPHPLYTRGFLLDSGHEDVPALAKRAWECGNAAQNMLVKARVDTLVVHGEVRGRVETPNVPALEAIGGTGDIVAGLVSAMLHAGLAMERACLVAARAARRAGELACPTPATQVTDILAHMEQAVEETLKSEERIES